MTAPCRALAALAALFLLPGCAAVESLDRVAAQAEVRSTCHTGAGDWVGDPPCTIEWSVSKTTSTTTTVVTTTTTPPASTAAPTPRPADD